MSTSIFLDVTSDESLQTDVSTKCRHYEICGRHALDDDSGLCMLHVDDEHKDPRLFAEALAAHRLSVGDNFMHFVFPDVIDFGGVHFSRGANFSHVRFLDSVDFTDACFADDVHFSGSLFSRSASFFGTNFQGRVDFDKARFVDGAAYFGGASFSKGASFVRTRFARGVLFDRARFGGDAVFIGGSLDQGVPTPMFAGVRVYLRNMVMERNAALQIVDADLRLCSLLDTDLSQACFSRVTWPQVNQRSVIYDSIAPSERGGIRAEQLEVLYRCVSCNYERHHEHALAMDFRFGANELRRLNPATPLQTRSLLTLNRWLSDYGTTVFRPLGFAVITAVLCAAFYFLAGSVPPISDQVPNSVVANASQWKAALLFSVRTMVWAQPEQITAVAGVGQWISIAQHVLGPLYLGVMLLAASRQVRS